MIDDQTWKRLYRELAFAHRLLAKSLYLGGPPRFDESDAEMVEMVDEEPEIFFQCSQVSFVQDYELFNDWDDSDAE